LSPRRDRRFAGIEASLAADPVPFPELGKADTRWGNGTGSAARQSAPERPESTPIIAEVAALPTSIPLARRTQRR
jgi:hypothetical protein